MTKNLVESRGASPSIKALISREILLATINEPFGAYLPSIRMEVVHINIEAVNVKSQVRETLGGQTVAPIDSTLLPSVAAKATTVVVGKTVEAVTIHDRARRQSVEGVVVVGKDDWVKVKVLLEVDDIVSLLAQIPANQGSVASLVGDGVAINDFGETSHVVREDAERRGLATGLRVGREGGCILEPDVVGWHTQAKGRGHERKGGRAEEHC